MSERAALLKRLLLKLDFSPDGCWLWTGYTNTKGYGRLNVGGKVRGAHRVVYAQLIGAIPDGLMLDHLCRMRRCVNPRHLRVVSARENALENSVGFSAVHAAKMVCPECGGQYVRKATGDRICLLCKTTHDATYREANRAKILQREAERYRRNRELILAKARARYAARRQVQ